MKHKLTFYLKTWLFSLSIILLTLVLGFLIFYFSTAFFLEKTQEDRFNNDINNIKELVEHEGINQAKLNEFSKQGYEIFIENKHHDIFYASFVSESDLLLMNEKKALGQPMPDSLFPFPESGSKYDIILTFPGTVNTLSKKQTVTYQSIDYQIHMAFPISITTKDYQIILLKALPIFLNIGLIISAIISIIYANFFSKKIQSINQVIGKMSDLTYTAPETIHSKDEMQLLENNLTNMYSKLKTTLQQLETEFHYIQRLEKDRKFFMKGVTHELKTPIMAMSTMIEGMLSNFPEYHDKEKYLQACYKELHRMTTLVNEILETSKLEGLQFQGDTHAAACLATVIHSYEVLIEDKDLTIIQTINPELRLMIPEKYLLKVFSNLIGNGIQYSPASTTITVETIEKSIIFTNYIKDNQPLDPNEIFKPFYSGHLNDDDENSHGLGLYIVRKILTSYDYQITCQIHDKQNKLQMIIAANE